MQAMTCGEIIRATNGVLLSGDAGISFPGISIDSRKVKEGELFIPIAGQRYDGHDFISNSLDKGAAGVLTQKDTEPYGSKCIIKVQDTLKALGDITAYYRQKFSIPFIGITGSVGKTGTKDMIAEVLSRKYNVLKTEGNYNNEIGLPLTLLNMDTPHEVAVVEMGMSGFGEIRRLSSILKPDIAVITNIGVSHMEKLGSRQNILKAKLEILEGLDKNGLLILNGDDKLLYGLKNLLEFKTVFYGMEEGVSYQVYNIKSQGEQGIYFEITIDGRDYKVHIPVPGVHNVYNALAAIAVGVELKVPVELIIDGIGKFNPGEMRLNIISSKCLKIIDDCYNASPQSMEAAIGVLSEIGINSRKIAVLGGMLELGGLSCKAHFDVGKFAVSKGIDYIITVGEDGKNIALGAVNAGADTRKVKSFGNNSETVDYLKGTVKNGDIILIKGSRGMKMEEIVKALTS